MDRIEKLLTGQKHKLATNLNAEMKVSIDSSRRPLPPGELKEIVNVGVLFDEERQSGKKYRLYGNIKSLVSNPLFNDNVKIFQGLKNQNDITQGYETKVVKVAPDKIVEVDGWFGYFDDDSETAMGYKKDSQNFNDNKSTLCQLFHFDPGPDRLKFDDPDGLPNYNLKITYPYSTTDIVLIDNNQNVSLKDGIPIIAVEEKILNERSHTVFKTPINHGLSDEDIIRFFKLGNELSYDTTKTNDYQVVQLGDSAGNNRDKCFVVDLDYGVHFKSTNNFNKKISTFKRVVNDVSSDYYVRLFKTITTGRSEYDVYPASYSTTNFGDEEIGFNFKYDINVDGLKDNLGRPLSELFLTIVKIDTDNDLNDIKDAYWLSMQKNARANEIPTALVSRFWTHIQGGFKTANDTDLNYNVRSISSDKDAQTGNPIYRQKHFGAIDNGIDESDDIFIGDISEYNEEQLIERILEPVWHRINTVFREYREPILNLSKINYGGNSSESDINKSPAENLTEGYIYRPHYRIKIREFSSFIETGDAANTIDIPDYATLVYSGDSTGTTYTELYKWRDFLDIGFYDELGKGVEYPFKSGAHYMYLNMNFFLERQDPPCRLIETQEELVLTIPTDPNNTAEVNALNQFKRLTNDPRFYDFNIYEDDTNTLPSDNDLTDGVVGVTSKKYNVTVYLLDYDGDYPLGDREIPGDCITLPTIERIPIDDVC